MYTILNTRVLLIWWHQRRQNVFPLMECARNVQSWNQLHFKNVLGEWLVYTRLKSLMKTHARHTNYMECLKVSANHHTLGVDSSPCIHVHAFFFYASPGHMAFSLDVTAETTPLWRSCVERALRSDLCNMKWERLWRVCFAEQPAVQGGLASCTSVHCSWCCFASFKIF